MATVKNNDNEAKASLAPIVIGAVIAITLGVLIFIKPQESNPIASIKPQISTESTTNNSLFKSGSGENAGSRDNSSLFKNSSTNSNYEGSSNTYSGSGVNTETGVVPEVKKLSDTKEFDDPYNKK